MSLEDLLGRAPRYPKRIVCLTEETTEILYRLGADQRIVGVSGFTVRPRKARRTKPTVSTFLDAKYDELVALEPDLVLGFSDLQADIARELVRRGIAVAVFNQRSVAEILQNIRVVGALVGLQAEGEALADELTAHLAAVAQQAQRLPRHPRVFFEEWHDPLISGIRWVSELVEVAGGQDIFAELRPGRIATDRVVDPAEVARRDPEVVVASWCGKMAKRDRIIARPGWQQISAVRNDQLYEITSETILQPGPAAITDGVAQLAAIIGAAARGDRLTDTRPGGLRTAEHVARGLPDIDGVPDD